MNLEDSLNLSGASALQSLEERQVELASDVVAAAYTHGDFVLSSGEITNYYFDKYLFETKPTILRRLAALLAEHIPADVDRLVSPEFGAVPIVAALSLESGLPFAIVRRATDGGGRYVAGELHLGERVVLVEDVISTGQRALGAAARVRDIGAEIVEVLAVVDRLQGASNALAAAGLRLHALLRVDELLHDHAERDRK